MLRTTAFVILLFLVLAYACTGHCTICHNSICFSSADCGPCACLIPNGQIAGECYGG